MSFMDPSTEDTGCKTTRGTQMWHPNAIRSSHTQWVSRTESHFDLDAHEKAEVGSLRQWVKSCVFSVRPQLRQEAEHLDVEPDQRDKQTKRPNPLVLLGQALLDALIDELEVQEQIERS